MHRIVAGITSLEEHLEMIRQKPEAYRPLSCPHCGIKQLREHGYYYRRVQSEVRLWIRRPVDVWTANSGPTPGWHGRHAAPACAWRFSVSTKRRPA
jgi:hypothetical protein